MCENSRNINKFCCSQDQILSKISRKQHEPNHNNPRQYKQLYVLLNEEVNITDMAIYDYEIENDLFTAFRINNTHIGIVQLFHNGRYLITTNNIEDARNILQRECICVIIQIYFTYYICRNTDEIESVIQNYTKNYEEYCRWYIEIHDFYRNHYLPIDDIKKVDKDDIDYNDILIDNIVGDIINKTSDITDDNTRKNIIIDTVNKYYNNESINKSRCNTSNKSPFVLVYERNPFNDKYVCRETLFDIFNFTDDEIKCFFKFNRYVYVAKYYVYYRYQSTPELKSYMLTTPNELKILKTYIETYCFDYIDYV